MKDSVSDYSLRLDLKSQADDLRRQIEVQLTEKIRLTGSLDLIKLGTERLKMTDLHDAFLDFHAIRMQALLTKI